MTIQFDAEARRRQFKKSDYAQLALHYQNKIIQVHVMAEYARLPDRRQSWSSHPLLLTAHRAKGLEFDHVLILDGGGWENSKGEERRLYYVAMTRVRVTLTLCARQGKHYPIVRDCEALCLKSYCKPEREIQSLAQRTWVADPSQVVLSWPAYFAAGKPIHRAIAELDHGSELTLCATTDGRPGWELADAKGVVVSRMAKSFVPPRGEILSIRVAAILARSRKPGDSEKVRCESWEVVLPGMRYLPNRT